MSPQPPPDLDDILSEEFTRLATVEVEGLVFELPPVLRALVAARRFEAAVRFLRRPELAVAWDVVGLVAPALRGPCGAVRVPGLLEYVCPTCNRRYRTEDLPLRCDEHGESARYSAVCKVGHLLPWLHRRILI